MDRKLYSKGYKKVSFFRLTNNVEIATYLGLLEIDKLMTEFQENHEWDAQHFCEYVNRIKELAVIKIV